MRGLVDTNLLVRFADPKDPDHHQAVAALDKLDQDGHELRLVPQNLYEFWAVSTRPAEKNGLGFSPRQVRSYLDDFVALFPLLRDERKVVDHWLPLVSGYQIKGIQAHDTRLVAAMQRHGLTHIVTFDSGGFRRFSEINVLTPEDVLA